MPEVSIDSIIVCDDIRREDNGKFILIGVYAASILVAEFPVEMSLCFFGRLTPNKVGEIKVDFRYSKDKRPISGAQMVVEATALDPDIFAGPSIPVKIESPGRLTLECRQSEDVWNKLFSIEVSQISDGANPGA